MGNARQIFHEHSVLFPAFLHHFTTGIKHDDVGEGLGPSALRIYEAIFAEFDDVQAFFCSAANHRKAREAPVRFHFGKLQRLACVLVRRRIGGERERLRMKMTEIET